MRASPWPRSPPLLPLPHPPPPRARTLALLTAGSLALVAPACRRAACLSMRTALPPRISRWRRLGNHEQDWSTEEAGTYYDSKDSGGECGVPTVHRFPVPSKTSEHDVWYR